MAMTTRAEFVAYFDRCNKTRQTEAHTQSSHTVAWSCDGRRLASGSVDKTVAILVLDNARLVKENTLRGHHHQVDQIVWHPSNPDLLASASADKTVRIWDARSKKQIASIPTKGENINIAWSPDGQTVVTGSKEDFISFIDARSHRVIATEQYKCEVNELSFNTEGDHLFYTNGQGQILIYKWPDRKERVTLQAHPQSAMCVCIKFDPTGKYFAVGGQDALVSLWDAHDLICLRTVSRLDWPVRAVSFSHDGRLLASGSEDLVIDIALVETGEKVCDVRCDGATFSLAWNPREYLLAFVCDVIAGAGGGGSSTAYSSRDVGSVHLFGVPPSASD